MRVLLLSCNTGGGHNSAAAAVLSAFTERGIDCDKMDALSFVSELHSDIVSTGHSYVYRHLPRLFGAGYQFEERHSPKFIYDQLALGSKKLTKFVLDNDYDAVVSTHIFGSMMMTEARRKYKLSVPSYLIYTDYCTYPGTDMVDADRLFIAADDLLPAFESAGIEPQRLTVSGIPIGSAFTAVPDKTASRRKLHLPEEGRIVLLFSGSIGCGNLPRIAPELEKLLPEDATLVIICGHNVRAYKQLKKVCSSKTVIVGFTNRIYDYMAASDLCISKPGGLSTTEMMVMELPMVLILSVPGCESHNMTFFENHGAAVGTEDWSYAIQVTSELVTDQQRLEDMKKQLRSIGFAGGASVVADTVIRDYIKEFAEDI